MPGGSGRRMVCDSAVISAIDVSTRVPGCRNTLMTATPGYDVDSMCSMSLTVVVIARSSIVTMRSAISCGGIPVYDQTTLTTGMSMNGKMSLRIATIDPMPSTSIRIAITAKV